ncbi:hypothetical protein [Methanosphaera cuniculi]|uniref:hypothetical protein n=1 Tax=Methanosphaera cuniculi TaxID=1077256 RepID=UPI0026DD3A66|nr:hypothetical protein [Methanosphaera cuniculi]
MTYREIPSLEDKIIYQTLTYDNKTIEIKTTINESNEITQTEYKDPINDEYINTSHIKTWDKLDDDTNQIYHTLINYVESDKKYEDKIKKISQNIDYDDPIVEKIDISGLNITFFIHNIEVNSYIQHINCEIWDIEKVECLNFNVVVGNNKTDIYFDEDPKTYMQKQLYEALEYGLNKDGVEHAYFDEEEEYNFTYKEREYGINISEILIM